MSYILTLVSSDPQQPLVNALIAAVERLLSPTVTGVNWLVRDKAVDLYLQDIVSGQQRQELESLLSPARIDHFVLENTGQRKKRLLVADMDNTVVIGETLDELADQCGLKHKVAEITRQAMFGELDFPTALKARVKMLAGLDESMLLGTLKKVEIMPGAARLVQVMSKSGATCILVSGGFTCFTDPIAQQLGFHHNFGNVFEIENGQLTGKVSGEIVDHQAKLRYLEQFKDSCKLSYADIVAVGDGANDLAMIAAAGLGVGYHPKPLLKQKAFNSILYGDLSALLYAQGYSDI